MAKDRRIPADSETDEAKRMTTKTKEPATITSIESASAARWLRVALAPARARAKQEPTATAVDRIRARVFGEGVQKKTHRSIAA